MRSRGRDLEFLASKGSEGVVCYPVGVMQELRGAYTVLHKGYVEGMQRLQFSMIRLKFSQ